MSSILKINKNISKVVIPYKDIFTTVYAVKTSEGVLPLHKIKELLLKYPNLDDEEICKLYNSFGGPTLGSHVVTAVRGLNDEM